jgi:hypothetical protein
VKHPLAAAALLASGCWAFDGLSRDYDAGPSSVDAAPVDEGAPPDLAGSDALPSADLVSVDDLAIAVDLSVSSGDFIVGPSDLVITVFDVGAMGPPDLSTPRDLSISPSSDLARLPDFASSPPDLSCVQHPNGLGQYYIDCADPLGTPGVASTYNSTMALDAANAWGHGTPKQTSCWSGSNQSCYAVSGNGACATWCYTGAVAGRVEQMFTSWCNNVCPSTTSTSWR